MTGPVLLDRPKNFCLKEKVITFIVTVATLALVATVGTAAGGGFGIDDSCGMIDSFRRRGQGRGRQPPRYFFLPSGMSTSICVVHIMLWPPGCRFLSKKNTGPVMSAT